MDSNIGKTTMAWPFQALSQSKEATENQMQEAAERNERAAQQNDRLVDRAKSSENTGEQKEPSTQGDNKPESDKGIEKQGLNLTV